MCTAECYISRCVRRHALTTETLIKLINVRTAALACPGERCSADSLAEVYPVVFHMPRFKPRGQPSAAVPRLFRRTTAIYASALRSSELGRHQTIHIGM